MNKCVRRILILEGAVSVLGGRELALSARVCPIFPRILQLNNQTDMNYVLFQWKRFHLVMSLQPHKGNKARLSFLLFTQKKSLKRMTITNRPKTTRKRLHF